MQRGIQRAVLHLQRFVGALLDHVSDSMTVRRRNHQRAQDKHVERSQKHIAPAVRLGFTWHSRRIAFLPEDILVKPRAANSPRRVIIRLVRFSILLVAAPLFAQADVEFFESRVRPVLVKNCYSCHEGEKQFSGLQVDSREALLQGGKRGAALVSGSPAESLLVRAIRGESGVTAMPIGGKLKADEIAAVEEWIRRGAVWPASAKAPAVADWYERASKTHWSFQPVKNPPVPAVRNAGWPRNEIDCFTSWPHSKRRDSPLPRPLTD